MLCVLACYYPQLIAMCPCCFQHNFIIIVLPIAIMIIIMIITAETIIYTPVFKHTLIMQGYIIIIIPSMLSYYYKSHFLYTRTDHERGVTFARCCTELSLLRRNGINRDG